jgi:hypothetical protein
VYANPVARRDVRYLLADTLDNPRDLVTKGHRKIFDLRNTRAIMCVGVTDASGSNANQNVARSDLWCWYVPIFQRRTDLNKLYRSHQSSLSLVTGHLSLFLANQRIQLFHVETRFPIMFPGQFEKCESILVGGKVTIAWLVQINETASDDEERDHRFR